MNALAVIAVAALAIAQGAGAATCRVESGTRARPLVELYTSEGCSSCPPADRWLSRHFIAGQETDGIALAFHVDYWDRLGWKDRFATPGHTGRQYQTMRANRATFVYTPQVVLQGRDFTGWRRGAPSAALVTAGSRAPRAGITLAADVDAATVRVHASVKLAEPSRRAAIIALAYVDSGLASEVRAGENRGERLTHDHVVRALETYPLASATEAFEVRLARPKEAGTHPAIVAFVQDPVRGEVLQSVALPLAECREARSGSPSVR